MNKIKVIFMVLLVFLASNNNSVYAKPHILISTQTSLCYERVYLTVYGDKHGNGDIWRYDNYYHNKFNNMVGMAKDISAGAVMLSTIISIVIGCLLFGQAIIDMVARGTVFNF